MSDTTDIDTLDSVTDSVDQAAEERLDLRINVEQVGPCKKHVRVAIPREAIDTLTEKLTEDYTSKAQVPGFRAGHVPVDLVRKRFRKELGEDVKYRILMQSLDQVDREAKLEPITQPKLDIEAIEIPEEGDFEFEFEVEVRPEFDLPDYKNLKLERPSRAIADADIDVYLKKFLEQYGKQVPIETAAQPGDFLSVDLEFSHQGRVLNKIEDISVRVLPTLRFQDAEITHFDQLMSGVVPDDVREVEFTISMESDTIEMRGETVRCKISVLDVKRLECPPLDAEFLDRIGFASIEELRERVRQVLERQVTYEQRQSVRRQVIEQITASAEWELPETLLRNQADNALRREILEMQQAGFTTREIAARENELRQRSLSTTQRNLKEHFVLDRIAEAENITVTAQDVDIEIAAMAHQSGENPRRVRSRLAKSGLIDNLDAQIRERKAVDVILEHATYVDVPLPASAEGDVEALNHSVCVKATNPMVPEESDSDEDA